MNIADLCIRNGTLPGENRRADLFVHAGQLVSAESVNAQAHSEIDATGLWLIPGVVDLAFRTGEPGPAHPASIRSEAVAAAGGGVCDFCQAPDGDPVVDNVSVVEWVHDRADRADGARLRLLGALSDGLRGDALSEMQALADAGCVGLSHGDAPISDSRFLFRALQYAADCGVTVHLRANDGALDQSGGVHSGPVSTRLGLPGIPVLAETAALAAIIELCRETGARLHLGRLSSARAVAMLRLAKRDRLPITADVAIHNLFLCDTDCLSYNANCHVQPPLRDTADRDALRAAVADGTIDAICSDHRPLAPDAKNQPFPSTAPGISGVDSLLALALELVHSQLLSPQRLIQAMATAPAAILGLERANLQPGQSANLTLIDPDHPWVLSAGQFQSACQNSPFLDRQFRGRAAGIVLNGRPQINQHWRDRHRV